MTHGNPLARAYRRFVIIDTAVRRLSGGVLRRFWSVWLVLMLASWVGLAVDDGADPYPQLGTDMVWTLLVLYAYQPRRIYRQRRYRAEDV